MILKNGTAIDPDSGQYLQSAKSSIVETFVLGLEEFCHVMRNSETGKTFAAVLSAVNITNDKNSYYKIQLLEADDSNQWFLFRA